MAFENVGCTAAIDRRRAWRQRSRDNLGVGMSVNGTALALIVLIASGSQAFALKIPIQAILTGGAEVPANDSRASGFMEGTFDIDGNMLEWTVTYSDLSSPAIGGDFHGPASSEENAPSQVGTPGSLTSPFHGMAKIDDTQAKDLTDGRWYFNLHSKLFPAGEIRGPVVRR